MNYSSREHYNHSNRLVPVHAQLIMRCAGCDQRALRKEMESKWVRSTERDPAYHMRVCHYEYCCLECRRENYVCSGPEDDH
jgi:hypothetical protein